MDYFIHSMDYFMDSHNFTLLYMTGNNTKAECSHYRTIGLCPPES